MAALLDHMHPWPLPNLVVIMDNAAIHKVDGIWEMVEEHGSHLIYLPAYSPDLNPIEEAFSLIKAWLRSNWDHFVEDDADPYGAIWEAVYSISPEDARGWYKHSSYVA